MTYYNKEKILEKDVYITESHQNVLLPWWKNFNKFGKMNLITIDTHTDTATAFRGEIKNKIGTEDCELTKAEIDKIKKDCEKVENRENSFCYQNLESDIFLQKISKKVQEYIESLSIDKIENLKEIVSNLRNDEYVDFAVRKDFFDKVFVISNNTIEPQKIPELEKRIFGTDVDFYKSCDDEEITEQKTSEDKSLLEENILNQYLKELEEKSGVYPLSDSYVLDIDLDFFKYKKWLNPKNYKTFYHLIKNAKYITIAIEREHLKIESGGKVNPEIALETIKNHIKKAQK
ncbi:MAG: UPF0489 family protein [Candidatus Moranbacteria bacterium]|nr:UPF0489 family protein [Candidatus Moranbacteria bacterium]